MEKVFLFLFYLQNQADKQKVIKDLGFCPH